VAPAFRQSCLPVICIMMMVDQVRKQQMKGEESAAKGYKERAKADDRG
jgi:hypothetical protein